MIREVIAIKISLFHYFTLKLALIKNIFNKRAMSKVG
jgi:hypothetical protein